MGAPTDVVVDARRGVQPARGAAAALVSTFVALMSHLLAGGAMPGTWGVVVPLVLATSVSTVLALIPLSWVRLTTSVAVSQVLFHLLFVLGAAAPQQVPAAGGGAPGHHAGTLAMAVPVAPHAVHASGPMWVSHVVATVVTVLVLRRGEAVLRQLGEIARHLVRRCTPARVPGAPVRAHVPAAPLPDDRVWRPAALISASTCLVRRGPPGTPALALV